MHRSSWDLRLARRFNKEFHYDSNAIADPSIPDVSIYDPKSCLPAHLGDFDRLLRFCGKPLNLPPPQPRKDSSESSSTHSSSTPASSLPEDADTTPEAEAEHFDSFISKSQKAVRWDDEVGTDLAERRRRRTTHTGLDATVITQLLLEQDYNQQQTQNDITPTKSKRGQNLENIGQTRVQTISFHPQWKHVIPQLPPIPYPTQDRSTIRPKYTLTEDEQKAKIIKTLSMIFGPYEPNLRENATRSISQPGGNVDPGGIHVFVDCSNIIIGCINLLKKRRGIMMCKQPPISFSSLALILERGRPVARRVLVGSHMSIQAGSPAKLPHHLVEASKCGYEMNLLERVTKPQTPVMKKKGGTGSGYATSGQSSASESAPCRMAMQEQGVDEILQMKLLETLIDYNKPSTIVLASGDAAEAEYSGGFLKNIERAMSKGWRVEVVAWSDGTSKEYTSDIFKRKWGDRFTLIELDGFVEEMLAIYVTKWFPISANEPLSKVGLGHL